MLIEVKFCSSRLYVRDKSHDIKSTGIGYFILEQLALKEPESQYLLGSRSIANGQKAIEQLRDDGVKANIDVVELNVLSDDSLNKVVETVKQKYGKLDGVLFPTFSPPRQI